MTRPCLLALLLALPAAAFCQPVPTAAAIDAELRDVMRLTGARGLGLVVIRDGQVTEVRAQGARNAAGDPLQTDTVMYGASLTKAAFAYTVMQLVEEGRLDLDASIARYLSKPLPDYPPVAGTGPWPDLKGDERWRQITPRILLTHASGFANFAFIEPDGTLRFHFDPGARYAYSGEGLILLQFVLEQGLGLELGAEMQRRVFDRFGMVRTSMTWRADFATNLADGWDAEGKPVPHDERSRPRAAGSMDTTLADFAKFAAGYVRGEGLSPKGRGELSRAQRPITTASQFPSFQPELPVERRRKDLAAGLGIVVFDGPQGHGFFKGGHNDSTANTWVCVEKRRDCVVILSNDVRAEPAFPRLVAFILGETGTPWSWEYGDMKFLRP